MEFANGNYALLASALQYANDTTAPVVDTAVTADGITPVYSVKFKSNEASSIYYTTDGSTPTTASTEWKPNRPRELPDALDLAPGTDLKWIAVDFKGNTSAVKSQIARTDRHPRHRRWLRRRHAVPDAGHAGAVRRVHAGHHEDVLRLHDGQRHLHRR